jgi:hypothetical protein
LCFETSNVDQVKESEVAIESSHQVFAEVGKNNGNTTDTKGFRQWCVEVNEVSSF